jgi:hypothetical protein
MKKKDIDMLFKWIGYDVKSEYVNDNNINCSQLLKDNACNKSISSQCVKCGQFLCKFHTKYHFFNLYKDDLYVLCRCSGISFNTCEKVNCIAAASYCYSCKKYHCKNHCKNHY